MYTYTDLGGKKIKGSDTWRHHKIESMAIECYFVETVFQKKVSKEWRDCGVKKDKISKQEEGCAV